MSSLPWEQSIPVEAVQLEAREKSIEVALAALKTSLSHLETALCCEQAAVHVRRAKLFIQDAIQQLGGDDASL